MTKQKNNLEALETRIGYSFGNQNLLKEALTHRSYLNENPSWPLPHNERLEYLGDAVLELAVTKAIFSAFPNSQEGELTLLRAALVNYQFLAEVASSIGLHECLYLSRGEARDSSRAKEVILANAIEALIGAIYIDGGFDPSEEFINKFVNSKAREVMEAGKYKDAKSKLQEFMQEHKKITPTYRVIGESGPDHKKTFRVAVMVGSEQLAEGEGLSKQEAETSAAKNALQQLD